MAATPLPIEVLIKNSAVIRSLAGEHVDGSQHAETGGAELWVRGEVSRLKAYSMVKFDDQAIAVHPLVQAVERFETPREDRRIWMEKSYRDDNIEQAPERGLTAGLGSLA